MRQAGYTLLEILLVIAVIAIGTVGIIATYSTVSFNAKVNQTSADIMEITDNVQTSWGNMQSYNGLTNATAVQQNLIPDRLLQDGGVVSPLGPVILGYAGVARDSLAITIEMSEEGCVKLIQQLAEQMHQIRIGGPGQSLSVSEAGHTNPSEVARLCQTGAPVSFIHYQKGFGRRAVWESW